MNEYNKPKEDPLDTLVEQGGIIYQYKGKGVTNTIRLNSAGISLIRKLRTKNKVR